MRKRIRPTHQFVTTLSNSHWRKAILLWDLRKKLQPVRLSESAQEDSHRRNALPVYLLPEKVSRRTTDTWKKASFHSSLIFFLIFILAVIRNEALKTLLETEISNMHHVLDALVLSVSLSIRKTRATAGCGNSKASGERWETRSAPLKV